MNRKFATNESFRNKKVYLAGAISGLTYKDGQDWRTYVTNDLAQSGIDGFSPLRAKDYLSNHGELTGSFDEFPMSTARGIMTRDHYDCMSADVILVNLKDAQKVSIGTVMEVAWAHAYRKPLVMVMESGNIHEHPMIDEAVGFRVDNLDAALHIIKAILLPR